MTIPCIQGERVAKVETKQDAIMERLEKLETKLDATNEGIHDIKQSIATLGSTFVKRDEFETQKEKIDQATGMVKLLYWFTAGGGLVGLIAFLQSLKLF